MLNQKQQDAITEIVNIGVGKGSAILSDMVSTEIKLNVPYVNVISFDDIVDELEHLKTNDVHAVEMKFHGEFDGVSNIILSTESANQLASLVVQQPQGTETFEEMKGGVLIEIGNIILNGVMGSFGNILNIPLDYRIPQSFEGGIKDFYNSLDKEAYRQILFCRTNFVIKGNPIEGEILIIYEIGSFQKLKKVLDDMLA